MGVNADVLLNVFVFATRPTGLLAVTARNKIVS